MLDKITWASYWTVVVVLLTLYYGVSLLVFFKMYRTIHSEDRSSSDKTQQKTVASQINLFQASDHTTHETSGESLSKPPVDENILMPTVHELVQELKIFIEGISEGSFVREEVLEGIQYTLGNYPQLIGTPYQKSINDFIKQSCEQYCSISLSEADVERVWKG